MFWFFALETERIGLRGVGSCSSSEDNVRSITLSKLTTVTLVLSGLPPRPRFLRGLIVFWEDEGFVRAVSSTRSSDLSTVTRQLALHNKDKSGTHTTLQDC